MKRVVVIGATGSIGRVVVPALAAHGLAPVAAVRDPDRARELLPNVETIRADVTDPAGLARAVRGADGIVLVHGSDRRPADVDYGAVPAVLEALDGARPRVVLMTSMAVTHETGSWREIMRWKARGERLLRASGVPATIVRPGWFDAQPPDFRGVTLEQGDRTPVDSRRGVSRRHIADAIAQSLLHDEAVGVTFELFSAPGDALTDWRAAFGALTQDATGAFDAALDPTGPPLSHEPDRVRQDMERLRAAGGIVT
ncbi:SDR family oxidoreductase [Demequina muriae]|uniref:SDR family oxidoreductase n=1 Tax=Demequina muriae TaxID=3051664 RepID=A0ABT8GIV7_9MICO|nr:SDR family oxidoreductase [Demequina sp. EGI L300058]MDN4481364.1 SDR family oxidoreductase [Demequina sp. EGI L300058]